MPGSSKKIEFSLKDAEGLIIEVVNGGGEFELAAAKLVFLQESGFVPDPPQDDPQRAAALEKLLSYATDPGQNEPAFSPDYRTRMIEWIRSLCRYADSF